MCRFIFVVKKKQIKRTTVYSTMFVVWLSENQTFVCRQISLKEEGRTNYVENEQASDTSLLVLSTYRHFILNPLPISYILCTIPYIVNPISYALYSSSQTLNCISYTLYCSFYILYCISSTLYCISCDLYWKFYTLYCISYTSYHVSQLHSGERLVLTNPMSTLDCEQH